MLWNAVIFGWASWQYSQVFTRPNPGTRESLTLFLVCERSWTWVWFSLIPSPSMIGDLGMRLGMINNLSTGPLASFPYHRTYCEDTKYFFIQNLSKNLEMGLDKRSASKVSSAFRMLCNKNCGWAWKQGYTISAHHATIIRPLSQAVTWVLHSPEPKAWPKKIWKISLIGCGTKLMGSAWRFFWSFITHVTYCWCTFPSEHSPKDTPFEDGTFKLTMQFTEEYPNKPPTVRFVSKMFHPNGETCWLPVIRVSFIRLLFLPSSSHTVYADGSICLDILQNRWSPTYDVSSILTSIQVRQIQFLPGSLSPMWTNKLMITQKCPITS